MSPCPSSACPTSATAASTRQARPHRLIGRTSAPSSTAVGSGAVTTRLEHGGVRVGATSEAARADGKAFGAGALGLLALHRRR